jgi:hypothetical protein
MIQSVDSSSFFFRRARFPAAVAAHPGHGVFPDNIFYNLFALVGPFKDIVFLAIGLLKLDFWSILNAIGSLISRVTE